jgi:putative hydrolase of the HAD superfamily
MERLRIVFDLDDTLYPERMFAISGFRACERWAQDRLGAGQMVERMTGLLDAGHMRSLFEIVLAEALGDAADSHVEAFIDVYRTHEPDIALYDDAAPALAHLGSVSPLGLITDGSHAVQAAKVKALGIEPRFTKVIYTSALGGRGFSKPNPLSYEIMEQAIGAPGDRFVYVGDNPAKDFITPNARGWTSIQIVRPQRIHHRAETAAGGAPQHTIQSLAELPDLLGC